jgi:hypothetical protein
LAGPSGPGFGPFSAKESKYNCSIKNLLKNSNSEHQAQKGTTSQIAEKLVSAVVLKAHGRVPGHPPGSGYRADKANRMNKALAPEGWFLSGFAIPLGFFRSLFSGAEVAAR